MQIGSLTWNMILVICTIFLVRGSCQPMLSSKQNLFGFDIYQDANNKHLYYYDPPDILLSRESDGSPSFKLLQMRYTGTHLYSDQGYKGFLNILQLSIHLEPITTPTYDLIKQTLGRNAELKSIPVKRFSGEIIIPLGGADAANEKYRKVTLSGIEASGESTNGNTFWQERTYTLQLKNDEAQLLWDQVETGKLGISFTYAFYAEAIPGVIGNVNASGTRAEVVEDMKDVPEEAVFDDKINTYLIKSNTFPIYIDVSQFPGCLKKVDINEELPPAYASFEVRCYDFSDDLRPDLFKKIVEIKAFGAAKNYVSIKADFNKNKPDVSSITSRFPYAIRLDQPLEYRVIEINVNGESTSTQWIRMKSWSEVIDVTTPEKLNLITKKSLDFELEADSLASRNFIEAKCEVSYRLNQRDMNQSLSWKPGNKTGIQNIVFSYDVDFPVRYRTILIKTAEEKKSSGYKIIGKEEDYIFIPVGN